MKCTHTAQPQRTTHAANVVPCHNSRPVRCTHNLQTHISYFVLRPPAGMWRISAILFANTPASYPQFTKSALEFLSLVLSYLFSANVSLCSTMWRYTEHLSHKKNKQSIMAPPRRRQPTPNMDMMPRKPMNPYVFSGLRLWSLFAWSLFGFFHGRIIVACSVRLTLNAAIQHAKQRYILPHRKQIHGVHSRASSTGCERQSSNECARGQFIFLFEPF